MKLLYIASPSYSGSTLLALLLGAHPQIATVGELKGNVAGDFDQYLCSCGMRIADCGFWQQVRAEMGRHGAHLRRADLGTRFRAPDRPLLDRLLRARVRRSWLETLRGCALRIIPEGARRYDRIVETNRMIIS